VFRQRKVVNWTHNLRHEGGLSQYCESWGSFLQNQECVVAWGVGKVCLAEQKMIKVFNNGGKRGFIYLFKIRLQISPSL